MNTSCVHVETWVVEYIGKLCTDIIYAWVVLTCGPVVLLERPTCIQTRLNPDPDPGARGLLCPRVLAEGDLAP